MDKWKEGNYWDDLNLQKGDLVFFWNKYEVKGAVRIVDDNDSPHYIHISRSFANTKSPYWHIYKRANEPETKKKEVVQGPMNKDRFPQSSSEKPYLLAAVDFSTGLVKWVIDDESPEIMERPDMGDGTNWYRVWCEGDKLCGEATCWFHSRGHFSLKVTDLDPVSFVEALNSAAELCYGDG